MNPKSLSILNTLLSCFESHSCKRHSYICSQIIYLLDSYNNRYVSYELYLKYMRDKLHFDCILLTLYQENYLPFGKSYLLLKNYLIIEGVL